MICGSDVRRSIDLGCYYWNESAIERMMGLSGHGVAVGALNSIRVYRQNVMQQ